MKDETVYLAAILIVLLIGVSAGTCGHATPVPGGPEKADAASVDIQQIGSFGLTGSVYQMYDAKRDNLCYIFYMKGVSAWCFGGGSDD